MTPTSSIQSRRELLFGTAGAATVMALSGCANNAMADYQKASSRIRATLPVHPDVRDFVRFATLAPSGHNTQPWHFVIHQTGTSIFPDFSRRTPVVDPDDHHLFVSLGCAAENFLIAAGANGRPGSIIFDGTPEGHLNINLAHGTTRLEASYLAIPENQSTRSEYDGRAISSDTLKLLEIAARIDGVSIIIMTDRGKREIVLDHVIRGNTSQIEDPAFVKELKDWIRFNPSQALATGDGLFSKCSGQPAVPTWIGNLMLNQFFKKDTENARYAKQIRSSSGIAVFVGDKADKDHWIRVGRSFQRFALQATALSIRHALINQPVEVVSVRNEFGRWLGVGAARPDLVVRFGFAPPMPMSMRRPVRSVVLS